MPIHRSAIQVTMRDPVHHYFGGGAAALNMHERMADLLLMVLSLSMESPGVPFLCRQSYIIMWNTVHVVAICTCQMLECGGKLVCDL